MGKAKLAPELMSDEKLWQALRTRLLLIENHWVGGLSERQLTQYARECLDIIRVLKTRGFQGKLFG